MFFLRKYLLEIVAFSALIIGILILANLIKFGYLSKSILVQNKDFIDVIGSIFTSILLIIGAVATYYRFFRGRTLSINANLNLDISIHETNQDFLLHVIDIEFINLGAFPIWEPAPTLIAYSHGISEISEVKEINLFTSELVRDLKDHIRVVDSQESEQFYAFHRVTRNIWAVTYVVQIQPRGKNKWTKTITVSNRFND